jgi:hypothetical protein
MPKPVKKTTTKRTTPKKPASDPNGRFTPDRPGPSAMDAKTIISAHMSELGRKGGTVSGAKRMQMPEKKRREIAMKAAAARWKKRAEQS